MQGLYQKLLYYGLLTLFVWPMPFFVAFDLPRKWPTFYSFWGMTAAMLPAFFGSEYPPFTLYLVFSPLCVEDQ